MRGVFSQTLGRFRRDDRGVVLILVVLLIVPLFLVIAVGIDFSQTLVVKRQLAAAVDAAALAIATEADLTDQAALDSRAEAFIKAHYPDIGIGTLKDFNVTRTGDGTPNIQVVVTATAEIPTNFMKVGGVDSLSVTVSSQVLRREQDLEVVMVLDNSGSMAGTKLQAMKDAATTLTNVLIGDKDVSTDVKIGLVPFTSAINVNVSSDTAWLDKTTPAPLNGQYLTLTGTESAFDFLAVMNGGIASNWRGCVRSRADPYDTQDTVPDSLNAATLFSAYFVPFAGANKTAYQGVTSSAQNDNCPTATVQPLTGTKATVTSALTAMVANGSTNIAEALAWGWRLISPDEPFTEGAPYATQSTIKAIILLTDGENAISGNTLFSSYGYGGPDNPQLGPNVGQNINSKTKTVCDNIKADKDGVVGDDDILLYTIVFNVNSATIISLMQDCATDASKFFNSPTAGALQSTFEQIASGLNQLRITK